jgi:hypothetical protein
MRYMMQNNAARQSGEGRAEDATRPRLIDDLSADHATERLSLRRIKYARRDA